MEVQWFLMRHVMAALTVAITFLCIQLHSFNGTPIHWIHYFLAFGSLFYFLFYFLRQFVEFSCKPFVRILYLLTIGGTYYFTAESCLTYFGEVHKYTSLVAVMIGVLLYIVTSFSDPGTVNAKNVSNYISAYPYDNIIFSEKRCSTCKFLKPARSKHCSTSNRCVARLDHHCGFMNNCIGEKNVRYFMVFLLWHLVLCLYGTIAIWLTLARGVSTSQCCLMMFLACTSLHLAFFFAKHLNFSLNNITTNEKSKWKQYESAAALERVEERKRRRVRKRSKAKAEAKRNMYDKGRFSNIYEIVFPLSSRQEFRNTNH